MKTISLRELELNEFLAEIRSIVKEELRCHQPESTEEWLDLDEACMLLKKAKQTIYQLCSAGKLPHYKRSGKTYFKRSELLVWLEDGRRDTR